LARTTRSVAPTDAGEQLLARLRPALSDVESVLDEIGGLSDRLRGRVRVVAPRFAATLVLAPKLGQFAREYPDVALEITTDDNRLDLVAGRFDAGIHLGDFLERDMIAVRVSPDQRPAIVASPEYFESHARPLTPRDLVGHRCINIRVGRDGVYRWSLIKNDESLTIAVDGFLTVDDLELAIRAALDGAGLVMSFEEHVAPHISSGALVRVLEDWCPPHPGFFLYYPSRRQQPLALTALIDTLRL
jgi:DNA-binding transcriptional LysR family regulator